MWTWLAVALGGALGSVGRYGVAELVYFWLGKSFPFGILAVNILGSLVMGVVATLIVDRVVTVELLRPLIMVGFLGGFTTFSSFSIDTVQLLMTGELGKALLNVLLNVVLCVSAAFVGVYVARWLSWA